MPESMAVVSGFEAVRKRLDDLGFYQLLVPESLPLVEAILFELSKSKSEVKVQEERVNKKARLIRELQKQEASADKTTLKEELNQSKLDASEKKIVELELLHSQATSLIKRLQHESLEKSRKILNLESSMHKAKVITKCPDVLKPKIEMSSLVKPLAKRPLLRSQAGSLDILKMYENKNKQLDGELVRLQRKLSEAKSLIKALQEDKIPIKNLPKESDSKDSKSAYMFKLIRENEQLKEELNRFGSGVTDIREGGRVLLKSKGMDSFSRSCEDIRTQVERSHMMMHNKCLRNQVAHWRNAADVSTLDAAKQRGKQIRAQQDHIYQMQDQLVSLSEENRELKRRVDELVDIKANQKAKIDDLNQRQNILLRSGTNDHAKVQELIGYIEQQRNVYKSSVEKLLGKLNPSAASGSPSNGMHKSTMDTSINALREIQSNSKRLIKSFEEQNVSERQYRPSPYRGPVDMATKSMSSSQETEDLKRELSQLRSNKNSIEIETEGLRADNRRLVLEVKSLKEENMKLGDELAINELALKNMKQTQALGRDEADSSILNDLGSRLASQERKVLDLQSQLATKQMHLQQLANDKDKLVDTLDNKTRELVEIKARLEQATNELTRRQADGVAGDRKLHQALVELEHEQAELKEVRSQLVLLRERGGAEKSVLTEFKVENNRLKDRIRSLETDKLSLENEVQELKTHVQKYINEIKRIEELFASRDLERKELLTQYKQLSMEVDSAESFGRKMQTQVESLQMQLCTKEAELVASNARLADLERDMVELSLNNENYRSKLANLGAQLDLATSELKESKSQATWINTDLSNVHQLAAQLNEQKVDLQNQIADQNREIEELNSEIRGLRGEVAVLTEQIQEERGKAQGLAEDHLGFVPRQASSRR